MDYQMHVQLFIEEGLTAPLAHGYFTQNSPQTWAEVLVVVIPHPKEGKTAQRGMSSANDFTQQIKK